MALQSAKGFRSKFAGKSASPGSCYQKKNQKITDFGRKRSTKSKIRGVFGAPGLGLQVNGQPSLMLRRKIVVNFLIPG